MESDKIKQSIKIAAGILFRKYGYHKCSVNEIARAANIAKATIYKYYDSKEQILYIIIMEYLHQSVQNLVKTVKPNTDEKKTLFSLILRTSKLSYMVCNEYIGWEFMRESTNVQEFLRRLSNELESIIVREFFEAKCLEDNASNRRRMNFLVNSSKNIVFSFAFTSVTLLDVRQQFLHFEKETLPFLIEGAFANSVED